MARLSRVCPVGIPQHVIQRGNNRQASYQINALRKQSELCTHHSLYLALGREPLERQENYCELFKRHVDGVLLENIRIATNKGLALGCDRFKGLVSKMSG